MRQVSRQRLLTVPIPVVPDFPHADFRPQIRPAALSRPQDLKYTARDGTEIRGFLTLPKGREAKGLRLVVLPHGGPYGLSDGNYYDDEVQLLPADGTSGDALWSLDTLETQQAVQNAYSADTGHPSAVRTLCIGPAGERLSRIAEQAARLRWQVYEKMSQRHAEEFPADGRRD